MSEEKNTQNSSDKSTSRKKTLSGVVVSTKMKDTVVVKVGRYFKHPKYGKYVKSDKRYKAHDQGNTLKEGDKVKIVESKPFSKDKRFAVVKEN